MAVQVPAAAAGKRVEALQSGGNKGFWARYRLPYLYILPALIVLAIVTIYPIAYGVYLASRTTGSRTCAVHADWVGFRELRANLSRIELPLPNFDFWRILGFNIIWTIIERHLPRHHRDRGRDPAEPAADHRSGRVWRAVFVIPWAMPPLVVATVWKNMFDTQFGAINLLLGSIGLAQ